MVQEILIARVDAERLLRYGKLESKKDNIIIKIVDHKSKEGKDARKRNY